MEYSTTYDNSLDYSPAFQSYTEQLALELSEKYRLYGKKVVGVGCGNGVFLKSLCSRAHALGTGYDPSFPGDPNPIAGINFVRGYFGTPEADAGYDFLCCRHVLEHIEKPLEFIKALIGSPGRNIGATFYFEVPNGEFVLAGAGLWDIIYPHVTYFTQASLVRLLQQAGLEIIRVGTHFCGQFLFAEARAVEPYQFRKYPGPSSDFSLPLFQRHMAGAIQKWSDFITPLLPKYKERLAFWGAGAKGVSFLNLVPGAERIRTVVDVNPRKQGMHVPGTGQRISSPDCLTDVRPSAVIVLNPAYRKEIQSFLTERGIAARVVTEPNSVV